ncbi:MAG: hypothetical protein GY708_18065 [Actinomycetia bacterium]|nr:hypothetical protein [Actinomycetes bacterium]MCP4957792.1 hypothetical protein [Actinomycetes bacterium]
MEDACIVDDPGGLATIEVCRRVLQDTIRLRLGMVLESSWIEHETQRLDQHRLVFAEQMSALAAASLRQFGRRNIENPLASVAPQALPVRIRECHVDSPACAIHGIGELLESFRSMGGHGRRL